MTGHVLRHQAEEEFKSMVLEFPHFAYDVLSVVFDRKEKQLKQEEEKRKRQEEENNHQLEMNGGGPATAAKRRRLGPKLNRKSIG